MLIWDTKLKLIATIMVAYHKNTKFILFYEFKKKKARLLCGA